MNELLTDEGVYQFRKLVENRTRAVLRGILPPLCSEEDMLQSAWLYVLRGLRSYDPRQCSLSTFIYHAAEWGALAEIRHHRFLLGYRSKAERQREGPPPKWCPSCIVEEVADERYSPLTTTTTVRMALRQMDPRDSHVLRQIYFEGYNLSELAREMKLSTERVRQVHNRAVIRLRKLLGEEHADE